MFFSEPITLSKRQHEILTQISSNLNIGTLLAQRAKIILLSHQGIKLKEIATQVEVAESTVAIWRSKWRQKMSILQEKEETNDDISLTLAIIDTLHRGPSKVKSSAISEKQLTQMIAIYDENPKNSGYETESWTAHLVTKESIRRGIVPSTVTGNMFASELRRIGFRNRSAPPSRVQSNKKTL